MCGIVGVCARKGGIEEGDLARMRDTLSHRGPDDKGLWIDNDRRVGLAHRRLSIIDLSVAGHQPMISDSGGSVLSYNGEIYNFVELREELEEKGCRFKSRSDTEVILHAYGLWGIDAIRKLNGMFAFALYDQKKKQIIFARDRFGEKPLYYYVNRDLLIFASELKAIKSHPRFSASIASDLVLPYVVWGNFPCPGTVFEHTKKLPPAHYLIYDIETHDCNTVRYWQPAEYVGSCPRVSLSEAVERLDPLLTDAVAKRLVADVPVGAFLSGGIDSSLIVAVISRLVDNLKTFTIGFAEAEFNEAPFAKKIAEHLGTEHYEYYVSQQEAQDLLLQLPTMYDEPFADSSAIPTYIVSKLAREQVKVTLTGDGGDELFGGYNTYPHFYRSLLLLGLPQGAKSGLSKLVDWAGSERMRRHQALLQQDEPWKLFLYINERTNAKIDDACSIVLGGKESPIAESVFAEAFKSVDHRGLMQSAPFTDMSTYLTDDILTKVDRASMAVSLEARVPLLDHRVAEFALGLSASCKMGPMRNRGKRVLRSLLANYLPAALFERPKRGFSIPLAQWFREDMRWLLSEYLDEGRLKKEGLFDAKAVKSMVQEHLSGRRDREAVLWSLVCWQMWREKWRV